MQIVIGILVAAAAACFVYLLLDLLGGGGFQESQTIEKRLNRLLLPTSPSITRNIQFSAIFTIDKVIRRQRFARKLYDLLILTGWSMPLSVFVLVDLLWAFLVYFFVQLVTHNPLVALISALAAGFLPYWGLVVNRGRYIEKFSVLFPDALLMMKNSLKAGQGIQAALQMVAQEGPRPISDEFARVIREIELGSHLTEALTSLSDRIPTRDVRMFVLGIFIQQEIGGNLAELFQNLEKTIRDRISLSRELRGLTAQGKVSGLVLILLPIAVGAMLWLINPEYFKPLFETEMGKKMFYGTVGMQILGSLIIRKMTTVSIST
ncbi:MAG: type II secretion system F family protein [Candidatus Omnitrophica bacterium]|nr:type II secretion system F family protein [Candidatus Omnitrophota bacterium]